MTVYQKMNKHILVVHPLNNKKKQTIDSHNNMDEFQKHYVRESDIKEVHILLLCFHETLEKAKL